MPILPADGHPTLVMAHPGEIRSLRQVPEAGYPGYDEYLAPSRFWGEKLGLPEIFRTYDDVLHGRHEELQSDLFQIHTRQISDAARETEVLRLFNALVEAHPDLPASAVASFKDAATIVHGCVSQFCPEDIRFYIEDEADRKNDRWRARKSEVERLAGGWHFEWCVSFETLSIMESRLMELGDDFDLANRQGSPSPA